MPCNFKVCLNVLDMATAGGQTCGNGEFSVKTQNIPMYNVDGNGNGDTDSFFTEKAMTRLFVLDS